MNDYFLTPHLRRFGKTDNGQALVLTGLVLVVLVLMAGLGVDVGFLRYQKQQMQKAADAAAIAGASAKVYGGAVVAAGKADAAANGFTDGQNGISVAINNPPLNGPSSGDSNYVEAIVSQAQPTFFMLAGGFSSVAVRGRSVASAAKSASGCIYVLAPSGSGTLNVTGTVAITSACGILINSNDPAAFTKTGSGNVSATNVGIVGGLSLVGSGQVTPTPITGIAPFSDPLAGVPAPTPGTCTAQDGTLTGSAPHTLYQGTFCGGIKVTGSGGVTFNPGIYILEGGGLDVTGSGPLVGAGVTFYNTGNSTYPYKPISLAGSAGTTLSAPTTGSLAGILFFQDRSIVDCCSSVTANSFNGSGGAIYTGALYFPTTPLVYTGSTTLNAYTILVAWTVNVVGSATISDNYSSLPGGASPIHSAALVE